MFSINLTLKKWEWLTSAKPFSTNTRPNKVQKSTAGFSKLLSWFWNTHTSTTLWIFGQREWFLPPLFFRNTHLYCQRIYSSSSSKQWKSLGLTSYWSSTWSMVSRFQMSSTITSLRKRISRISSMIATNTWLLQRQLIWSRKCFALILRKESLQPKLSSTNFLTNIFYNLFL